MAGHNFELPDNTEDFEEGLGRVKSLSEAIRDNLASYSKSIDRSGILAKVFEGNMSKAQIFTKLTEASAIGLAAALLKGSDSINKIQKATGLSFREARKFQNELAISAVQSGKLFVNSTELNKAFTELTAQTGLFADFGGDTLITFTALNKQIGLASEQAGKLSLLARIQSEDTEGVLDNTVATVSAISQQNGVAINAKAILDEISNTSSAIVVSLGMNPELLAEAAAEAKLFGANLATIDRVAESLLNFESSINAELQAELITGKQLNFERARLLALNNDLAGVTEEIKNNEALTAEFASGNRIEQQLIADAIGLSRDQLADIVMGQELARLGAENFREEFGEVAFQQLQAQSAAEKFQEALVKVQGIIGDIGTILAPIVDAFAFIVGAIAESKIGASILVGVFTALATKSIATAISSIFAAGALGGPIGLIGAGAAVAGMLATIATAVTVADDMHYGNNMLVTKDKGTIVLNNDDTVIAGTNLGGGGIDYDKMANAISKIQVNTVQSYDSFKAQSQLANHGSYQEDVRYQTKFA
jgi:hypothetical protein